MWNPILLDTSSFSFQKHVSGVFLQVRNATKRAAGSRTSMKDSAGRRLGPKKMKARMFPQNLVCVRYYLDPFHPKRKFIGVALRRDLKLPSPHFEPTMRRFGRLS
ncbi:BAF_HP2_G0046790.mRNA.1.CDS.1 [Saccharomyces cerevisiae]|nr:BAF_HP2_G0046790.mRNA.1.CDS.1 [Saccharomyces cerevisiae]CAI6691632.1 BAF_HP2_G0046790.mRNA.1.CDS.1 [Saccharomyces cerevisiae]